MTRRRSPAVSTKRQVSPPSSSSSSTGSTVVPATESTTLRSVPVSRFSRLDLPTFGRPTSATRRGPPSRLAVRGGVGQLGQDRIEQIAGAAAVQAADRVRLPQPERPGLGRIGLAALVVDLGHRQDDRTLGPAQRPGHHQVGLGRAGAGVDDEQHQVGGGHRLLGLPRHHRLQSGGIRFPAAGVDQGEPPAAPFGVVGDPVPGHPGDVLHHRFASAEDPVHQGRLADVGPADHGHDGSDGDVVGGDEVVLGGGHASILVAGVDHLRHSACSVHGPVRVAWSARARPAGAGSVQCPPARIARFSGPGAARSRTERRADHDPRPSGGAGGRRWVIAAAPVHGDRDHQRPRAHAPGSPPLDGPGAPGRPRGCPRGTSR